MDPRVPHPLIDALLAEYNLPSDAALARALGSNPPEISRVRNRLRPMSAAFILHVHEATDWPIKRIKELSV
jgi:hypothetical protein